MRVRAARVSGAHTHLIVVHLETGVDAVPGEPDHMVLAVIDPDAGVLHHDILLPEVIDRYHVALNLEHEIIRHITFKHTHSNCIQVIHKI